MSFSTRLKTGELSGVTVATQNPDLGCQFVKFFMDGANVGNVYIGGPGVTIPDGTTDLTSGVPFGKGEETPWIPISNLNESWRICDNVGDDCVYMVTG